MNVQTFHRTATVLLALVLLALAGPAPAQESATLNAIKSGAISGNSKLALPPDQAPGPPGSDGGATDFLMSITRNQERNITDKAFPLMTSKWPFNRVFVCWENPDAGNFRERELVRRAIAETWEANSGLSFLGWNNCQDRSVGIRILIEDSGPHVKYLGKYLNGIRNGMVLNFTFNSWGQACKARLDYCIRGIGVHEFGHAIGFAHEQNRPDTPGECDQPPQGTSGDTMLTPWDKDSVMNYCNEKYNNDGQLSEFDIVAVRYIYGEP